VSAGTTRWPAVFAAIFAGIVGACAFGKMSPALPLLKTEVGLSLIEAGWLVSTFNALAAAGAILFGVFADVGIRSGVPASLMVFTLLFASSWFSTITPQGGTQNVIFVGSGYLTQRELYRLGALTTAFCLLVFLAVGTPWLLLVAR